MAGEQDELLSIRDAAKQCGKNPETVRRWVWSGRLHAEKLGNQLFVKKSDLIPFCGDAIPPPVRPGLAPVRLPRAARTGTVIPPGGNSPAPPAGHEAGSRDAVIQELRKLRHDVRSLVGELEADDNRG